MPLAHTSHTTDGTDAVGWLLVALLVLVPSFAYLTAARARRGSGRTWPSWRAASFVIGLVLVAAVVSPALHTLGHHDPRGHMIQHLLLGMFAPLALVLAAPVTLLLGVLPVSRRGTARTLLHSRVLRGVAHPVTAAALDMGGLYLLYLSPLYTLTVANPLVHHLVSLHFLLAGYLFSWSIAGPDPAPCRPSIAIRAGVLIAAGAAHAYLAKLLYARAAEHLLESSHDLDGMQAAAQLMYYGGDLAELALATALFAMWYRSRQPATRNAHHVSTSKTRRSPRHAASTKRDRLSPCMVKTREKEGTRTPGEAINGTVSSSSVLFIVGEPMLGVATTLSAGAGGGTLAGRHTDQLGEATAEGAQRRAATAKQTSVTLRSPRRSSAIARSMRRVIR
jgi:putative membrane protein